jgi:SAM-dependent methyltransferase
MPDARSVYTDRRRGNWDAVCRNSSQDPGWSRLYHQRLTEIYKSLVLPGRRVIEFGCGEGDLLAALKPAAGVGVDFSEEMVRSAKQKYPELEFVLADAHEFESNEAFDVIVLSDILNDLWDVQGVFERLRAISDYHTRVIINCYSRLWELPLGATKLFGLAKPTLHQNWLTVEDINSLLLLADFEPIRHWSEILCPLDIPLLERFCNLFVVKLWPFTHLGLTNFIVARPSNRAKKVEKEPLVSVIVPARNEAGNIPEIFKRIPEMGSGTELVFVEGHSNDETQHVIEEEIRSNPQKQAVLLRQTGEGKGDAVRMGFQHARGDVLMILDADLTVPPEDLPRFYKALVFGKGDFINGVRLVYPMEDRAMRFFNLVGNKSFSLVFSWLLGQPIKDTLCGTKVLWRDDYRLIAENRSYFGTHDPFGDFDLILAAARLNLKIVDLPIRYRERLYGTTNIRRWKHGMLLLRMVSVAALKLKFI